MKHLYFLSIVLFSLSATAQLKDCTTCASQVIKEQQISKLSIDELRFLTNDLYARKGYKFKEYEISNYFEEKSWYKPVSDNSKVKLNAVEEQNVKLFQERTAILKADREKLIEALRSLKAATLKGNSPIPKGSSSNEYFSKTIAKIDIDDIHWIKNQGYYSVEVDNFKKTHQYYISIEDNEILIYWIFLEYSKKAEEEKLPKTFYENEIDSASALKGAYIWSFTWENSQLVFKGYIPTG